MTEATINEELARELRQGLVSELVAKGAIRSDPWRRAFAVVPRHAFVSTVHRLSRRDDSVVWELDDDWLERAYTDDALVTQVDRTGKRATSSSTTPSLMASMLEALDVDDGHTVLEIGTGTGYNAALLCEHLGSDNVVSIDIYPELVDSARKRLAAFGYRPILAVADGRFGYAERAPYDHIIATCSVPRIPTAWLDQTRPGGRIVVNVGGELGSATASLTVGKDGFAEGRFMPDDAGFIRIEGESEPPRPPTQTLADRWIRGEGPSRAAVVPAGLRDDDPRFWFLAQFYLPHIARFSAPGRPWCFVDYRDLSWARLAVAEDGSATVTQGGPQRLWDLLEVAHDLWVKSGTPGWERYGLTVRPGAGQHVWLDAPDSDHRWKLADS